MPTCINSQAEREIWERLRGALLRRERLRDFPVLVLAAHPDDETIGASLLLAQVENSMVAFLTRGAPRDRRLWPPAMVGSEDDYAKARHQEALRALRWAGVSEDRIFSLHGVDQEAIFQASSLAGELKKLVEQLKPQFIVTHPYEGGHPDHDAAALIARLVRDRVRGSQPALIEMTSYHAHKGRSVTGEFLPAKFSEELCLELSIEERERKQQMLEAYRSQQLVLASFTADCERLRPAPAYDFHQPPHAGRLWYEQMGWALSGKRWRELAQAAEREEASCRSPSSA
jgi:LmbE family N-acetylglucosaminyl deacetylase